MKKKSNLIGISGKMTLWQKIRYCLGSGGDELPYALFYTYFMIFLTEIAGIPAVTAGIISACAAACDGLIDPTLGIFSDNLYRKYGTRQPGMIIGLGPLAVVTILLFIKVPLTGGAQIIYYALLSLLFVTFYSQYSMNFVAMAAEITDDYQERNFIRFLCGIMAPVFAYVGHSGPNLARLIAPNMSTEQHWFAMGLIDTSFYVICCIICIFVALSPKKVKELREKGEYTEMVPTEEEGDSDIHVTKLNFISNMASALRIKALKHEIIMILGFSLANGFLYALIAYVLDLSICLSASEQAVFWAVASVAYYLAVVICVPIANKFGKRPLFIGCYAIASILMIIFFIIGFSSLFAASLFIVAFACIEAPFWTLYCTWGYEISDIDEFAYGKRRTTMLLSIASVFIKVGPTLSYIFTGIILTSIGYVEGGVVQAAGVGHALHNYITLLPGICLVFGGIGALLYPVTKTSYEKLIVALEAKKAGKEYSVEGFEFLLPEGWENAQTDKLVK